MNRKLATITLAHLIALLMPLTSMAASHDAAAMHGMAMSGTILDETVTMDGVVAAVQLFDRQEAMAKSGMEATHHLMINFSKVEDGTPMADGVAAVKVTPPSGEELAVKKMMPMGTGFGVDLALKESGTYTFTVGTKLDDGKRRQFLFRAEVK